ncbi:hypothetical protein JNO54_13550 [Janibacter sp. YIM B02568]|uniref:hypothetical protein n=1 Tax=Janibacter endophyticus TaxID=2806261 RepID=UPI001950474B|nr:hypothetical protein [Janibacter endophyticus]MBM6547157.1 hypothetical protein [Janibacter endophyticus]
MISRARRAAVALAVVVAVLAPAVLAAAQWPSWWEWIAKEQTPMTRLQSVSLVVAAVLCWLVAVTVGARRSSPSWPWFLLGAGFAALGLDERFAIHERVRDRVLAPRDITLPFLPWVGPGDFLMIFVALAGLLFLPVVWRSFAPDPGARRALVLGVVLAVVAVGMDSIDPEAMSLDVERLEQTVEEIVELASALSFLTAVALRLIGLLGPPAAEDVPAQRPVWQVAHQ